MNHLLPNSPAPLVLVVDDDLAMRQFLRLRLQKEGYNVEAASDGSEALAAFQQLRPDLVLLDAMMPHLDGFETCRRLRVIPGGDTIPVLMVTALNDAASMDDAFAAGATDFVTKPLAWPLFRHRVRKVLQLKVTNDELRLKDRALAAASNAIMVTEAIGEDALICFANHAWEELSGYGAGGIQGQSFRLLFGPETDPSELRLIELALQGKQEAQAMLLSYRQDGSRFWNGLTLTPVPDVRGVVTHHVWTLYNMTERMAQAQARERELARERTLMALSQALNHTNTLDAVLDVALMQALNALRLPRGAIYLREADELVLRCFQGIPTEVLGLVMRRTWDQGLTGEAMRLNRPVLVSDIPAERPEYAESAHRLAVQGQFSFPLRAAGEVVGVMNLNTPHAQPFSEEDTALALAIADQVGVAIERARLYETLRDQTLRDPLTGLYNRRHLKEMLDHHVTYSLRLGQPVCVLMVDLDHFKGVNDRYGHEAGDLLLQEMATFFQRHVRVSDIVCRYGGEEFTLVLPDTPLDVACQRADHLRREAKSLLVTYNGEPIPPVSLSIGIAACPAHTQDGTALLFAADTALYRAKADGRDRWRVAEP